MRAEPLYVPQLKEHWGHPLMTAGIVLRSHVRGHFLGRNLRHDVLGRVVFLSQGSLTGLGGFSHMSEQWAMVIRSRTSMLFDQMTILLLEDHSNRKLSHEYELT